jgi:hypothetical protein
MGFAWRRRYWRVFKRRWVAHKLHQALYALPKHTQRVAEQFHFLLLIAY